MMKIKKIIKQRIKNALITLPGFKEFYLKNKKKGLNDRKNTISESEAKHYVDLDLAALHDRYLTIQKYTATCKVLVSIIIVNRNGLGKLKILMNSFHRCSFYRNFEIIFIDNASTDDSVNYMQSWDTEFNIRIIQNTTNKSFSAANNQGAREAKGEYLLFLNNDTEVTDGWLDELIFAMENAKNPGAIGAKLIYPIIPDGTVNEGKSWLIQHTGIAFRTISWKGNFYFASYNTGNGETDNILDSTLMIRAGVTAAVLLIKKTVFELVGGFDEQYIYGYEDVDLGLKLINENLKNYYCPTCVVFHYESATLQKINTEEMEKNWQHNAGILRQKWGEHLSGRILSDKIRKDMIYTEDKLVIVFVINQKNLPTIQYVSQKFRLNGYSIRIIRSGSLLHPYNIGPDVDILVSCQDSYDISKIYNVNPYIKKIAWIDQNLSLWEKRSYYNNFDLIFVSNRETDRDILADKFLFTIKRSFCI